MSRIETPEDIVRGLDALVLIDPRLAPVRAAAGAVPLRRQLPGFASLASIVVAQQVSRASADAILARLHRLVEPLTPERLLAAGAPALAEAGLSRAKQRALIALGLALQEGCLDLDRLEGLASEEAIAALTTVPGIGPWTAEVYLLVAVGHGDVFPAGDVALQAAVARALGEASRPDAKALALMAESWRPWRAVAARLFWAYYRQIRGQEAAPAA